MNEPLMLGALGAALLALVVGAFVAKQAVEEIPRYPGGPGQLAQDFLRLAQMWREEKAERLAEVKRLKACVSNLEAAWNTANLDREHYKAEVERLRAAATTLREQLEDLDDRAWTPDERDARAILIREAHWGLPMRGEGEK